MMRFDGQLLTQAESLSVIEEVNAWCRRTGTNYNKLVTAAQVNVSTRSSVLHRNRCLTIDTARRLRAAMAQFRFGISKDDHKARLRIAAIPAPRPSIPARVNREPCPRCGVRADVGCEHSRDFERATPVGYGVRYG